MAPRLDHLRHGEFLRVIGLQVRRHNSDLLFELLERDARNDADSLYPATAGNAVIAVQSPQKRRLTRPVVPVNDPVVAGANLK